MYKRDSDNSEQSASWPPEKKKKRKSRWTNDEADKTFIPGMPTTLPADATEDQKEQYLLQLQIEESTRRLRSGDLGIPANPEERSPSPEPIYNNEGKRMNTREYRTRKALEEGRHEKIQKLLALNANYKPPTDYKPPIIRVNDKVMIPQDDHPEINFVGLLIGPRGNTLKTLEKETGAKIIIRGKGSVKEGKIGRKDGQPLPGEDEPLHAYITANDPANVKKAVARIHEIIKEGIEIPEEKNDLRKQQLRELALLNGTLRENDSGLQKLRQIAEAETIITNQIICTKCGAAGHIARDCTQKTPAELAQSQMVASKGVDSLPANTVVGRQDRAKMDSEYMSLMAELGQVAPETVRADLASKMPPPLPAGSINGNGNVGGLDSKMNNDPQQPTTAAAPALSADYGYGGRRSRFGEFDNSAPKQGGPRFDNAAQRGNPGMSRFDQGPPGIRPGQGPPPRFDQGPPPSRFDQGPPPSRFDQGPPSSRFDQGPPPSRFDQGPPPSRFDQGHPPSRFDQGPPPSKFDQGPPPSRFDQGPPRYGQGPPPSRFDQGPPRFDHGPPRFPQGPPPSRFDQRPPPHSGPPGFDQGPPPHSAPESWTNDAPQPPRGDMMKSNRWGPLASAPPPPPQGSGPAAPPPPPPTSSWSQPQPPASSAPWQQPSSAPAPPWQSSSGFGGNPAAPPPPPSSSGGFGGSGFGYGGSAVPPPPPPQ